MLVPGTLLQNSGICGNSAEVVQQTKGQLADKGASAADRLLWSGSLALYSFVLSVLLGVVGTLVV